MSVTEVATAPVVEQEAQVGSTFDIAVGKIMDETGCNEHDAAAGLKFVEDMANAARTASRYPHDRFGVHHLTADEMSTVGYHVMDQVMPHGEPGATSADGSAHRAIENHVLRSDEFSLTHANPTGLPQDCKVVLTVGSVG